MNTCNVNTQQTFPKHLFKTVSMILLFLCTVNVPLALNCFKDAGLLFYQSDGNDPRQHLRDAACCNLLILLFVFQLIRKFLKYWKKVKACFSRLPSLTSVEVCYVTKKVQKQQRLIFSKKGDDTVVTEDTFPNLYAHKLWFLTSIFF